MGRKLMAQKEKTMHIVLASGGTGGHIFPAEALAVELIKNNYKDNTINNII